MPRRRPNPEGWEGGSEDFTYLTAAMQGRLMDWAPECGEESAYTNRRNDQRFSEYDLGDADWYTDDVDQKKSSPYRSGRA